MWYRLLAGLPRMDFITTGIPSLDMLLGGGVRTGATTEFFGERGVGKSKIVHQLCVNVQLPPSRGGLEGKAIFIDTEGSFRREWVAKIASALGLRPAKALRNILVKRVFTTEEQMSALEEAEIEREGVKLVVVDALNSLFKKEYFPGKWVERHQKLARHLHTLNKLADMKDLAVVVTNHVVEPRGESGVGYAVRTRVRILKGEGEVRIARLVDDPMLEEMERPFYLPG